MSTTKLKIAQGIILFNIVFGCIVMLGWLFDITILTSVMPQLVPVKVAAAIGFIFSWVIVYFLIARHITERKKIENAESDFIQIASHQLRASLTVIQWSIERLLKIQPLSEQAAQYVQDIRASAMSLAEMARALLNVSLLEGGTVSVHSVPFDVAKAVRDFLDDNAALFAQKKLSLTAVGLSETLPVMTSFSMFNTILQVLISNAVEYTPREGAVRVALTKDEHTYTLAVTDSGIGIPAEAQARVFEKFFRAGNAKSTKPGGMGLGLYIAQRASVYLGGRIWFELGVKEGGTTFYAQLPRESKPHKEGKSLL